MSVRILRGDCREILKTLPDESVHCVVTSPPYWGLRDYGVEGQLGLEATPYEFVDRMVEIFRDVRRVLRSDGTLWLNLGDCYATGAGAVGDSPGGGEQGARWRGEVDRLRDDKRGYRGERLANGRGDQPAVLRQKSVGRGPRLGDAAGKHEYTGVGPMTQPNRMPIAGLKPKELVGAPWRVALALQAGFATCDCCALELRADVWPQWNGHKVCVDCLSAGRLSAKVLTSERGWYLRQDIIWQKPNPMPESVRDRCTKAHEYIFLLTKNERYYFDQEAILEPASENTHARLAQDVQDQVGSDRANAGVRRDGRAMRAMGRKPVAGWATGAGDHSTIGHNKPKNDGDDRKLLRNVGVGDKARPRKAVPNGPKESDDPRVVDATVSARMGRGPGWRVKNNESFDTAMAIMPLFRNKRSVWTVPTEGFKEAHFATFPTALIEPCILAGCPEGGTVLDPFGGAGTTGLVADRHHRSAVLIELNPAYADMAERRIVGDAPLFVEVSA